MSSALAENLFIVLVVVDHLGVAVVERLPVRVINFVLYFFWLVVAVHVAEPAFKCHLSFLGGGSMARSGGG